MTFMVVTFEVKWLTNAMDVVVPVVLRDFTLILL